MRAARFAAQLGFTVAPEVVAAMTRHGRADHDRLGRAGPRRAGQAGAGPRPGAGAAPARRDRAGRRTSLPELPALALERDEHHRHKDVYEHTLTVLRQSIDLEEPALDGPDFVSRFAALMHDVGKPRTRRFAEGGTVTFHHHDVVGAKLTRKRMQALRFPNDQIDAVAQLVEQHLRFHGYGSGEWTDSAVRRYVRDAGDQLERLHVLTRADCTTRNQRKADRLRRTYDDLEARIERLSPRRSSPRSGPTSTATRSWRSSASDPGREVGEAYRHLLELRLDHGPMSEEEATQALLEWAAGRG